ncbi:contact-dependent growth inhibition system immunity protein [Pseudescherichia sp.]|uniref:contact-dependent growth inhibition system immunity protein n=1 Tax=Pseudescherichia sp. TaxID=2055881 RepID=UPI00289C8290|nr:contact-dependent growth inhibition system immunity protein [Pseudescherichia sp.]
MSKTYPRIEKMMAGYINMDAYEIAGSSDLKDQVSYFISRVSPKALRALVEELDRFEREHADNLADDFEAAFDYGANIQDTQQFFNLVRDTVWAKLGEKAPRKMEDLSATGYRWILDSGKLSTSYNVISDEILRQFAKKLDELSHGKSIDTLRSGDSKHKRLENFKCMYATSHDIPDAYYKQFSLVNVYANALVHKAAFTPRSKRVTEQYVHLLETILTFKGVTVGQDTSKPAFGLSVEDIIQMQERKSTQGQS